MLAELPVLTAQAIRAYRLVNSKFPPIALFNDVADAEEFEALYQIQALTNPRLQNEVGRLELLPVQEIPFGTVGCSYAVAPFTHINPAGSRFSSGAFGMLYLADTIETAIAEVRHHQQLYWSNVDGLSYERFVFRGLACSFNEAGCQDATVIALADPIYAPSDYSQARELGMALKKAGSPGLRYHSVRAPGSVCWGLLTPRYVSGIVQCAHYEMIWSGEVVGINKVSNA